MMIAEKNKSRKWILKKKKKKKRTETESLEFFCSFLTIFLFMMLIVTYVCMKKSYMLQLRIEAYFVNVIGIFYIDDGVTEFSLLVLVLVLYNGC